MFEVYRAVVTFRFHRAVAGVCDPGVIEYHRAAVRRLDEAVVRIRDVRIRDADQPAFGRGDRAAMVVGQTLSASKLTVPKSAATIMAPCWLTTPSSQNTSVPPSFGPDLS